MNTYAVHDGTQIVNVIVAESLEVAEQVTGLPAVETGGVLSIGWKLHGDTWRPPMPTEGVWEWDADTGEWINLTPDPGTE